MLTDERALDRLWQLADMTEEGQSQYWRHHAAEFVVERDGAINGNTVLGNATRRRSALRHAAHRALQYPLRRFARRYRHLRDSERIGIEIARRQGRQFTYDFLRQVFTLSLVREHVALGDSETGNLVIGDGYGSMASLLLATVPDQKVYLVNLTKPLFLDVLYLRRAFADVTMALVGNDAEMSEALADPAIRVIAVRADDADLLYTAPIGLAINVVSMQEMEIDVIRRYFDILRRNPAPKTAFYCCNRRDKVTSFADYPWSAADEILEDGICEWSQWYYTPKPPFWHRRNEGLKAILHRMAWLDKGQESERD